MKKVCFLIPHGNVKLSSLSGAIEIFEIVNDYLTDHTVPKPYQIRIASAGGERGFYDSKLFIDINNLKYQNPDLIIIPGMFLNKSENESRELANWVVKQYGKGCEIASLCTGSFFLASTGLLDGLECSTHWKSEYEFRLRYPQVNLCTDKIFTDYKGLYTSGGAHSSLNLILYLIEKYDGREIALACSKILQIDLQRSSQSQFILFEGLKNHDDDLIRKVQLYVEKNFDKGLSVENLADKFNMSKRNFIRRFKKVTYTTPIDYIHKVKIETAKRKLENNNTSINEVMYSIGYNDAKAFRSIFRKITGLSPTEYKQKFSMEN